MAMARNLSRSDNRKWRYTPGVPAISPAPIPVGAERMAAIRRGNEIDRMNAMRTTENTYTPDIPGEGPDDMSKKNKKAAITNKKAAAKRANESKRAKWHGLGVIKLITHMGALNGKGKEYYSPNRAMKIIKAAGLDTTLNTIIAYLGDGKRGLGVVDFNREQLSAFRELADKYPADPDEKPRSAGRIKRSGKKKDKGSSKKTDKKSKSGKKHKKAAKAEESSDVDEAELAAAQAEADFDGDDD